MTWSRERVETEYRVTVVQIGGRLGAVLTDYRPGWTGCIHTVQASLPAEANMLGIREHQEKCLAAGETIKEKS